MAARLKQGVAMVLGGFCLWEENLAGPARSEASEVRGPRPLPREPFQSPQSRLVRGREVCGREV